MIMKCLLKKNHRDVAKVNFSVVHVNVSTKDANVMEDLIIGINQMK